VVLVLFLWGGKAQINAVFNAVVDELGGDELTPGVRPNSVSVEVAVCAGGSLVRLKFLEDGDYRTGRFLW